VVFTGTFNITVSYLTFRQFVNRSEADLAEESKDNPQISLSTKTAKNCEVEMESHCEVGVWYAVFQTKESNQDDISSIC